MPKSAFPRVIHRIWIGSEIPPRLDEWWQTWQGWNPEWECRTWRDADVAGLVGTLGLSAPYEWAGRPVLQADLGRLAILWIHGGMYVDADTECLKPIEGLVRGWEYAGHRMVMASEPLRNGNLLVSNAIAFATPRHEAVKWMLTEAVRRLSHAQRYSRSPNPMWATGPRIWAAASKSFSDSVHLCHHSLFMPFVWEDYAQRAKNWSRIPDGAVIPDTTYAVHHSSASWLGGR